MSKNAEDFWRTQAALNQKTIDRLKAELADWPSKLAAAEAGETYWCEQTVKARAKAKLAEYSIAQNGPVVRWTSIHASPTCCRRLNRDYWSSLMARGET